MSKKGKIVRNDWTNGIKGIDCNDEGLMLELREYWLKGDRMTTEETICLRKKYLGERWMDVMMCYKWYFERAEQVIPEGYNREDVKMFYKKTRWKVEEWRED